MQGEIIQREDITGFQTKAEEFSPFDWYKKMLETEPIHYHPGTDTWNVFKYEDVKRVLTDYELFSSKRERTITNVGTGTEEGNFPDRLNIHDSDPPAHRKSRSLLATAFTPKI